MMTMMATTTTTSRRMRMGSADGAMKRWRLPEPVSELRSDGFQFLHEALFLEEQGSTESQLILSLYQLGSSNLEKAIQACQAPNRGPTSSEERDYVAQKCSEMVLSLEQARQRVQALSQSPVTRPKSGPTSSWESSLRSYSYPETPTKKKNPTHRARIKASGAQRPPMVSSSMTRNDRYHEDDRDESRSSHEKSLKSSIVSGLSGIGFDDVIGQEKAKQSLRESVILPILRPELFHGLRTPTRGLLLFGPPGNGKTLLVKALASETQAVLFSITAASLTSKYVGEGEKMMKTLFQMAAKRAPSIIFIDEIDSLLSERKGDQNEASLRMKTEFLAGFDGVQTCQDTHVLVIGATNRPEQLDLAALRRFSKRIFVEIPDFQARFTLLSQLLSKHGDPLPKEDLALVAKATAGYSGSDLTNLARDAAFGPIRDIPTSGILQVDRRNLRAINLNDFRNGLKRIRVSITNDVLQRYHEWNAKFGDVSSQ
ncbi:hypothetical protein TCAL_07373 [Tigriopus californicus]|uniref:microtubule-severing ATPase n=1 Tax=Tigriopus californicus TaxID=6832 RepID=A0A553PND3_TIGCA|nr:spastin-like [Tigriopus californicus]TRY79187.1 hypothetical protein TCAL_07373 [Tigriopus californicus]|eukprot:TCALIF_07373-PA protein Name:"Similar to spast Spastin (Xenopus laevis)" AED:0.08 eAED:0.08 QI:260/1/0.6/1/0.5/0.6/5/0/483